MGFEAMANDAPVVPMTVKEIGKKKRVSVRIGVEFEANRSAKLKQCKLDARREQWLSQVKSKEGKNTNMASSQQISEGKSGERRQCCRAAMTSLEHDGSALQDSSDAESPTHSLNTSHARKECPINNSSSSSSTGSWSRSVSDADEDGEDETGENGGGGLDDWEAVADALSASPDNGQDHHLRSADSLAVTAKSATETTRSSEPMKQDPDRTIPRAWRPDDVFRPQSLPNLSKQRSFPVNMERCYDAHHNHRSSLSPPPSSCPICYEDLDLTDSSFLPCSCGFRLCLFCHKRILEADARCPGCRKQYNPLSGDEEIGIITGVGLPPLSYRLGRSFSMSSRS
ncbi:uncharacterized protein LOC109841049 isoform X2 [Asparagus officinalis]|uniref:uncharacterized protein LOC109841049 isoform X2 n=1 Tax=Asparagus officinalis TaxID=4686 RepID=UPI00098E7CAC|nr:uncharacterized protein LOC109841049 isoform X2 [Asparagus officinalis]